ncbi:hypothetical protein ACFOOP_19435 [Marinicaulis aureus]|uniref:Ribbon-helix-helix protein CopG domain-containing protein n=1 Tax=Hyphococcus aureus TaxID=2666033 RepID=A0ABW1KWQ3_9PROT
MNAYAPNSSSSNGGNFASLTSSLLARKGEALPAVDAVAHEGVDVEMRPLSPANNPGGPASVGEDTISSMYPAADREREREIARATAAAHDNVQVLHAAGQRRRVISDAPKTWTIPPQRRRARGAEAPTGVLARKAIVTLKMPARDLVRLRLAGRDLEMSCQAIILDALECYLDANDVPSAEDDEAILREVERLVSKAKAKRAG